jgi:hypothetical protein
VTNIKWIDSRLAKKKKYKKIKTYNKKVSLVEPRYATPL